MNAYRGLPYGIDSLGARAIKPTEIHCNRMEALVLSATTVETLAIP